MVQTLAAAGELKRGLQQELKGPSVWLARCRAG